MLQIFKFGLQRMILPDEGSRSVALISIEQCLMYRMLTIRLFLGLTKRNSMDR